jgi:hypothetical protein
MHFAQDHALQIPVSCEPGKFQSLPDFCSFLGVTREDAASLIIVPILPGDIIDVEREAGVTLPLDQKVDILKSVCASSISHLYTLL